MPNTRPELEVTATIANKTAVLALLDSGAYANYLSAQWVANHLADYKIHAVHGEFIQLGGTATRLPVLGRVQVHISIPPDAANIYFNIFETERPCIIGLESLLLHFHSTFTTRLDTIRKYLMPYQINTVTKLLPLEPKHMQLDKNLYKTALKPGEETIIATGEELRAPEEDTAEQEYKEIFSVPSTPLQAYLDTLAPATITPSLANHYEDGFHFHSKMKELMLSALGIQVFTYDKWEGIKWPAVDIRLRVDAPPHLHARVRTINRMLFEPARTAIHKLVTDNILRAEHETSFTSPIVVVPKQSSPLEPRICGDYVELNKIIQHMPSAVPDPKKEIDKMKNFRYYADTDWVKGFHQIPITDATQRLLAINTPFGTFVPNFLPMGVQPASGILAHIARSIFGDLGDFVVSAQDNLLIGGHTLQELYHNMKQVLERAAKYNVKLSPTKTHIGVTEIKFFGYVISHGKYWVQPERQAAVLQIPFPRTLKALQHFLGAALFVSPFIKGYSELTASMSALVGKDVDWKNIDKWQPQYVEAFEAIKQAVAGATELYLPDMSANWLLRTDASDIACGSVLLQWVCIDKVNNIWEWQPIAYTHHKFSSTAVNWSVLEKELYALVFSLQKLDYYLRMKAFVVETDHSNILYLQQSLIPKLIRWKLFVHSYIITLRHIPGRVNVFADALSRLYYMSLRTLDPAQLHCLMTMGHTYATIATTEMADSYGIDAYRPTEGCGHQVNDATITNDTGIPDDIWLECHARARGHRGAKRTYLELGSRYPDIYIPMAAVQQRVDSCPLCQKFKTDLFMALKSARHVLTADVHNSQVSIDVAGMETDSLGNDTCFIMVNHNTKLVFLYAANGKSERNTINACLAYIGTYGIMQKILSDPGGEFSGTFTKALMNKLGVTWDLTIAERPQSHGTERTVGKAVEAVRMLLAETPQPLDWSEPAVLATTAYLLNSEANEETGFSAFDLTFGQQAMPPLPPVDGVPGKQHLQEYLAALQRHLDTLRDQANTRRIHRQQQRLNANTPPGDHRYSPGDLVFVRDDAPMRSRKFIAKMFGPYEVQQQDNDGAVSLRNLVDDKLFTRHHNRLRIFDGTLQQATTLARLDNNEELIRSIDGFRGNVYLRRQTEWHVNWADGTSTWEALIVVEKCVQLTDYVNTVPYLHHRYGVSADAFKTWQREVNALTLTQLLSQRYGFYPSLDPERNHPFALSIQYFDKNNELQSTVDTPRVQYERETARLLRAHDTPCFLRAHMIKRTPARADIFIPCLSSRPDFKKLPAKGAFVRSFTIAELLEFAGPMPENTDTSSWEANDILQYTNFRQLVWPEQWNMNVQLQKNMAIPLEVRETEEQIDIDEHLTIGARTGEKARLQTCGKWYDMQVGKQFPDGDYLCVFNSTGNDVKVPERHLRFLSDLPLLKRKSKTNQR